MCAPVAAIAAAAAAVASAGGALYAGSAARQQGLYEQRVAERNRQNANDQARDALERGDLTKRTLGRRVSALKGEQVAAMAANGVDPGFGSALETQRDTAMFAAEDADALNRNIAGEMRGFSIEAANYRSQGQAARMRGSNAQTASYFQAGASLLGGASQFGDISARLRAR